MSDSNSDNDIWYKKLWEFIKVNKFQILAAIIFVAEWIIILARGFHLNLDGLSLVILIFGTLILPILVNRNFPALISILVFIVELWIIHDTRLLYRLSELSLTFLFLGSFILPALMYLIMKGFITQGPFGIIFKKTVNLDLITFLKNTGFTKRDRKEISKNVFGTEYDFLQITEKFTIEDLRKSIWSIKKPWTVIVDDNNRVITSIESEKVYGNFLSQRRGATREQSQQYTKDIIDALINRDYQHSRVKKDFIFSLADPTRSVQHTVKYLNKWNLTVIVMVDKESYFEGLITTEQFFTLLFIYIFSSKDIS